MFKISLEEVLQNVSGSSFIGLDTETSVKLLGGVKNALQGRVTKRTLKSNVQIFQNKGSTNSYENMVNKRLEQEGKPGTFKVGPRPWGTRIPNTPFIEHNGKKYLEVIYIKSGKSEYLVDGVASDVIIEGLPSKSESGQGGLERQVVLRTIAFDSILAVTIGGRKYSR